MSSKKSMIRKVLVKSIRLLFLFFILGGFVFGFVYWKWVVHLPGDHMQKESILQVIAQDSQIHYKGFDPTSNRNEHPIGSMFSGHHRQSVSYTHLTLPTICSV